MEVNVKQAQKMFFSKSSFEMIYFEAFANALDAGATTFNINIELSAKEQIQNLSITIEDNGCGFTDEHFRKFSKLFDVDERTHKGLGRLVYLCYFDNVHIESVYDKNKKRIFDFDENFNGKSVIQDCQEEYTGTILKMYWKSHATLTLLAKQDLPTLGHNMIDPLKSWCWGGNFILPF